MQRPRHRRSKSASGIEAIRQVQKPTAASRLSTDSYPYADGRNGNDMFIFDLGPNSLERGNGVPIKKLLAEEMSKEVETKRRSPSVIARLMGLEALPSPRHNQKQQKRFMHSHQYDDQSTSRNLMEEQVFKDVYEDLEAAHIANRRCSSRWNANSIFMEPDMALIQEKFKEAKRLSTDEKFLNSKQLNDTLELLESKEMLMKFLHQPDSMFVRPVHESQVDRKSSHDSHIAVLKPLNSENYDKLKSCGSARDTSRRHSVAGHVKYGDGVPLEPHNRHRVHISRKSPEVLLPDTNEENIFPTRIVVLKPNIGKKQNANTLPVDSHVCPHRFRKMEERRYSGRAERVLQTCNDSYHKVGSSIHMSNEARELAREIARKMRDGSDETMGTMSTGFFGYAGDESSCDPNETDSESESEMFTTLSCRKSFDHCNFHSYIESSTNKEAKKRLPERWRTTRKYQDLEVVSKGSTLGEMLALPDRGARTKQLNAKGISPTSNKENALFDVPLGISSKDGWKDESIRTSSRSRSLPPINGHSCKRRTNHYEFNKEGHLTHNNSVRCSRSKSVKGKHRCQEDLSSKISRSKSIKPLSCSHMFTDETDSSSEASFETQMTSNTKDILEDPPTCQTDLKSKTCENPVFDSMMTGELGSMELSSNSYDLLPEQPPSFVDGEDVAVQNQEDSACQDMRKDNKCILTSPYLGHTGAEPESLQSSKEADHSSPVSVLEIPFAEVALSSESFERVSAELHELRMQLKLLKMESGTLAESSSMLEEEVEQLSPTSSKANNTTHKLGSEGWEITYALDVLIDSGFEESDFDMFRTTWYSHDSPLDPKLFDSLENKYSDETNELRPERRLLFDIINSSLSKIFQDHVDLYPWVKPKLAWSPLKLQNEGVIDALEKLINQNLLNGEISDLELDQEMQWPNWKGEIDVIGSEIESLLMDDMIKDIMCN